VVNTELKISDVLVHIERRGSKIEEKTAAFLSIITYDLFLFSLTTYPLQLYSYGNSFAIVSGTEC